MEYIRKEAHKFLKKAFGSPIKGTQFGELKFGFRFVDRCMCG